MIGPASVSLFLVLNAVSDPVNAPKMVLLGCLGFALMGLFVTSNLGRGWNESKWLLVTAGLFLIAMCNSLLNSDSPSSQNLYGVYGRNTGFITYLSLVFILLGALQVRRLKTFELLIYGFFFVGFVNVIYCAWVLIFGDFISWNNPYGSILGTFGNPNFISAFLGMFISGLYAFVSLARIKNWVR